MTEEDEGGYNDKINRMVRQWESESTLAEDVPTRHVVIRNGNVLDSDDGLLMKYLHKFACFFGGPVSRHGQNPLNWIHKDDLVSLYAFVAENSHVSGVLNGVAPSLNNHHDICMAVKQATKRPSWFSLPRMAHEMWYNPDVAKIMHESSWVEPKRTLSAGFHFRFGDLDGAIQDLVAKPVSLSQVARYRIAQRWQRHQLTNTDSYFYKEYVEKRGWNPVFVPFIAFFSYFSWFFLFVATLFGSVYVLRFVSLFTDPV